MSEVPPDPSTEYSPYPRQQPGSPDTRPARVSLDCISDAIQLVKQDLGIWVLAALVTLAISYGAQFAVGMVSNIVAYGSAVTMQTTFVGVLIGIVFGFFASAVSYSLFAGMVQMALARIDGRPADISELFNGFGTYPQMLIATILTTIAVYVGLILLIIPGLFVSGALAFVPFLVVRQHLSGVEAVSKSWEVLKPHAFGMFGFMFVMGLLVLVGVILCGVGVLFTFPVACVSMAYQYRAFFPESVPEASHPIGMEPPKPQW